ncbi:hypothetical protein QTP88_020055 [Uroleucon formosanum]
MSTTCYQSHFLEKTLHLAKRCFSVKNELFFACNVLLPTVIKAAQQSFFHSSNQSNAPRRVDIYSRGSQYEILFAVKLCCMNLSLAVRHSPVNVKNKILNDQIQLSQNDDASFIELPSYVNFERDILTPINTTSSHLTPEDMGVESTEHGDVINTNFIFKVGLYNFDVDGDEDIMFTPINTSLPRLFHGKTSKSPNHDVNESLRLVSIPYYPKKTSYTYIPVNLAAISGSIAVGIGYSQLEEMLASIDIPCMSDKIFQSGQNQISESIHHSRKCRATLLQNRRKLFLNKSCGARRNFCKNVLCVFYLHIDNFDFDFLIISMLVLIKNQSDIIPIIIILVPTKKLRRDGKCRFTRIGIPASSCDFIIIINIVVLLSPLIQRIRRAIE